MTTTFDAKIRSRNDVRNDDADVADDATRRLSPAFEKPNPERRLDSRSNGADFERRLRSDDVEERRRQIESRRELERRSDNDRRVDSLRRLTGRREDAERRLEDQDARREDRRNLREDARRQKS